MFYSLAAINIINMQAWFWVKCVGLRTAAEFKALCTSANNCASNKHSKV